MQQTHNNTKLRFSVIICTRNRPLLLKKCLLSILSNKSKQTEIIVVDQSEGKATKELIQSFGNENIATLFYVKSPKIGKSYGLNLAIKKCRGEFICFTDDDCTVPLDWFETIEVEINNSDFACLTGRVLPENSSTNREFLNLVLSDVRKTASQKTNPWKLGCVGCNMVIRKSLFQIVDGFDEKLGPGATFKSALDGDMVYRILKKKRLVVFSPALTIFHSDWRGREENNELRYNYSLGLGAFAAKYFRQGDFYPACIIGAKWIKKFRRMCLGVILFQKIRLVDGYIHIKGISTGFFQWTPELFKT